MYEPPIAFDESVKNIYDYIDLSMLYISITKVFDFLTSL